MVMVMVMVMVSILQCQERKNLTQIRIASSFLKKKMCFVKKKILMYLIYYSYIGVFFVQNSGRLEESPASIARSLARERRMKEMEKFFIFRDPRGIGITNKIASFSSFPFLVFCHFYDVGRGSRTIIRKVSLPSDGY